MEAEIDLWRAVLAQAISDTTKLLEKGKKKPKLWNDHLFRMDVRHLRRWFLSQSKEPGSFRFVCEVLDLDHARALGRIQEQFLQHMVLPRWKPEPKEEKKEKTVMNTKMNPTLSELHSMPIGELAELSPEQLANLQQQAAKAVESAKLTKEFLEGVISRRYADKADLLRKEAGKDFGTVRFIDGDVQVTAELPKRPHWDQKRLSDLFDRIRKAGEDPQEYMDVDYKVPESKFKAWPSQIRSAFEGARTVKAGKPTFKLSVKDEQEIAA
ncbi:hypothetical protein Mmc1_2657 [Magnetococcus marinus MC-1]|uniref:Uncharacterized protein n=1 Tax=Magnetococcus marinus (strain ATCC BAA-1437 / JCM 17883 / MC-1) TaxID=156889 RepID=A0LB10_MAGMM|nr:hypothetical protein Mmc1_2657 [Magnetococcus marinus MC-1]